MEELYIYKPSFLLLLAWSILTILLHQIIVHFYNKYNSKPKSESVGDIEKLKSTVDALLTSLDETDKLVKQLVFKDSSLKKNDQSLVKDAFVDYLESLGQDIFGESINIDVDDMNVEDYMSILKLNKEKILLLESKKIHDIFLKMLSHNIEFFELNCDYTNPLVHQIVKDKTDIKSMIKNLTILLDSTRLSFTDEVQSGFSNVFKELPNMLQQDGFMQMMQGMMGTMNQHSNTNEFNINNYSDSEIKIEELTELEKEMQLITD